MSQFQFNANTVPGEHGEGGPLPSGIYNAVITGAEVQRENDKGTKQLLITWAVTDGEHKGRTVRNYVTFVCPTSTDAQNIGLRFIKNICQSIRRPSITDTADFLGVQHVIKVGAGEPKQGSTKAYAEVKMTYPKGSGPDTGTADAPPAATPPAPETPPATQPKKPWEK